MNLKQQTIDTYNSSAVELAAKFNSQNARVGDIKRAFTYIEKENPSVLEIGCGNGRDAQEILKYTENYLGIDISRELIKLAQEAVSSGTFKVKDVDNFDFPRGLDIVFAFASLHHSDKESIKSTLNKVYDALDNEGVFYISLKLGEYQQIIKKDKFGTRTHYLYLLEDIKKLAGRKYKVVYEDIQDLRGQKWFTIVLQK